ncbi:MAG: hypothetical protein ABFS56_32555 [Pseudomonadota bacterium]
MDDNPEIVSEYQNHIAKQGFIVEVAHDGTEGLSKRRGVLR